MKNAQNDPRKTVCHFAEGRIEGPAVGHVVPVGDRGLRVGYPVAASFSEQHGTPVAGWVQAPRPVPSLGAA